LQDEGLNQPTKHILQEALLSAYSRLLASLARLQTAHNPLLDLATGVARRILAGFPIPSGARLQSLTELVLKYSPLEVSLPWASAAVRECLGEGTELEEDGGVAGRKKVPPSEATWEEAGRGYNVVTASEPSGREVRKQQAGGKDEGILSQVKPFKPSEIAPGGDCEEDMRRWVEEGGLESGLDEEGLKTEVPGLEEEGGRTGKLTSEKDRLTIEKPRVEDAGLRTEVLELEDDNGDEPEELPVVMAMTIEGRRQVLGLVIEFLVGTLGRAESALLEGGEEVLREDGMQGQVAAGEGGHVELDLDQLTQVVSALTNLCKGVDLKRDRSARNVFEKQQMEERGGLGGLDKKVLGEQWGPKDLGGELLDERGGLRVLECVCLALRPVDETVVWLTELCENALLGAEKRNQSAAFERGHLDARQTNLEDTRPLSQGTGLNRKEPLTVEIVAGGPSSAFGGHLPGLDILNGLESKEKGPDSPDRLDGGSKPCGELEEEAEDWRAAEAAGSSEGGPDAAQVQVAVDLARLGFALHRAAEGMMERNSSRWPKVSVSA
jgi:hypothetical protein